MVKMKNNKTLRQRLKRLIEKEAFFRKRVILSSGRISNYYIDIRKISLKSQGAFLIANLFWQKLRAKKFDFIGGPTLGADPILSALSYHAYLKKKPISTFIIRKEKKKHGRRRLLEGADLPKGSRLILIDDVATSGASLVEAVRLMRRQRCQVNEVMVVVDREEGAKEALEKEKCRLDSLFVLSDFI